MVGFLIWEINIIKNSWFEHIAISTNAQKGDGVWLETVTDEEYNNLK